MIGVLQDKKGFKKEVYMSHRYPMYHIVSWDNMNDLFIEDGAIPSTPVQGKSHIFYPYGEPTDVHGAWVQLYKEQ